MNVLKCSPGNLLHHLPHHLWEVIVMAPPPVLSGTAVIQFLRPCVSWNGNRTVSLGVTPHMHTQVTDSTHSNTHTHPPTTPSHTHTHTPTHPHTPHIPISCLSSGSYLTCRSGKYFLISSTSSHGVKLIAWMLYVLCVCVYVCVCVCACVCVCVCVERGT